jgi:hypothetical protein
MRSDGEIVEGGQRCGTEEKPAIFAETSDPDVTLSAIARRRGLFHKLTQVGADCNSKINVASAFSFRFLGRL